MASGSPLPRQRLTLKDQTEETQTQAEMQMSPGTGTSMSLRSKCQLLEVSSAWLKIDMQVSLFTCQEGSSHQIRFPSPSYHPGAELSTICNCKFWLRCCQSPNQHVPFQLYTNITDSRISQDVHNVEMHINIICINIAITWLPLLSSPPPTTLLHICGERNGDGGRRAGSDCKLPGGKLDRPRARNRLMMQKTTSHYPFLLPPHLETFGKSLVLQFPSSCTQMNPQLPTFAQETLYK